VIDLRCADLYIAGLGCRIPATLDVAEAVADGRYDADEQTANQYESVAFSDGEAPAEMAVHAARLALSRSGIPPADIALLLHASAWFQGLDYWPAACYIHREVLGNRRTPALDVQQVCNSVSAIELAASYLTADPTRPAVLLTTGDRYESPGFDRWRGDVSGIVYGDGGASVVLARQGVARLLAVATIMETRLEPMYRGDESFSPQPGRRVDVRARRQAFMEHTPGTADWITAGLVDAVERTLQDAGAKVSDVTRWVFPNVGLGLLQKRYLAMFGLDLSASVWEWGRRTAHVSVSDQLAGLTHLLETGQLRPGDLVMLVGIGGGFGWSGALVEITERPGWA
jgi:3-oxoacyl-[acyl-carrier-protein] synthase III